MRIIDNVIELLEGEFQRAGIVIERTGEPRAVVLADPDLLHQVFVNLLLNAVHAVEALLHRVQRARPDVAEYDPERADDADEPRCPSLCHTATNPPSGSSSIPAR